MNLIFEKTFPLIAAVAPAEFPEETAETACVIPFAAAVVPLLAAGPGNVGCSSSINSNQISEENYRMVPRHCSPER